MLTFSDDFGLNKLLASNTATRLGIRNMPKSFEEYENLNRLSKWLALAQERVSENFKKPVKLIVTSAYRSEELNRAVGGSPRSAHMRGLAADVVADGTSPKALAKVLASLMAPEGYDQIILEFNSWVHVSLAERGRESRMQTLTAIKAPASFGRKKTKYLEGLV